MGRSNKCKQKWERNENRKSKRVHVRALVIKRTLKKQVKSLFKTE